MLSDKMDKKPLICADVFIQLMTLHANLYYLFPVAAQQSSKASVWHAKATENHEVSVSCCDTGRTGSPSCLTGGVKSI